MRANKLTKFGEVTRPARRERGISLGEFARRIGKSPAAVSLYELRDENFPFEWIDLSVDALALDEQVKSQLLSIYQDRKLNDAAAASELNDEFLDLYLSLRNSLTHYDRQELSQFLRRLKSDTNQSGGPKNAPGPSSRVAC